MFAAAGAIYGKYLGLTHNKSHWAFLMRRPEYSGGRGNNFVTRQVRFHRQGKSVRMRTNGKTAEGESEGVIFRRRFRNHAYFQQKANVFYLLLSRNVVYIFHDADLLR